MSEKPITFRNYSVVSTNHNDVAVLLIFVKIILLLVLTLF